MKITAVPGFGHNMYTVKIKCAIWLWLVVLLLMTANIMVLFWEPILLRSANSKAVLLLLMAVVILPVSAVLLTVAMILISGE